MKAQTNDIPESINLEPITNDEANQHSCSPDNFDHGSLFSHPAALGDATDQHTSAETLFFTTPSNRSTHWSIAWSDLMMTMFVLFMVMFIYKSADKEFLSGDGLGFAKGPQLGHESTDSDTLGSNNYFQYANKTVSRVYDFSRQLIEKNELNDFASIDLEADRTLRIVLTGDLLFDAGDITLKKNAQDNLLQISKIIYNTPYMINIIGHTDDLPVNTAHYPSNWELSALRASSVARFLIEQTELPPSHFYVTGHSYHQPIVPNDSPGHRAKNRRVEIVLTKNLPVNAPSLSKELDSNFSAALPLTPKPTAKAAPNTGDPVNAI